MATNMVTDMENVQVEIEQYLKEIEREGMDKLMGALRNDGFYNSPASTRFHGAYPGGLATHSLAVYNLLIDWFEHFDIVTPQNYGARPLKVIRDNIVIATLLHDTCKIGRYLGTNEPYTYNKQAPKGHAMQSLLYIAKYIRVEAIEEMMIRYHMGFYGLLEYDVKQGEYHLTSKDSSLPAEQRYGRSWRNAAWHNPIIKYMYFADEIASMMGG